MVQHEFVSGLLLWYKFMAGSPGEIGGGSLVIKDYAVAWCEALNIFKWGLAIGTGCCAASVAVDR